MNYRYSFIFLLFVFVGTYACNQEDSTPDVLLPSNLNVDIEVAQDGSGNVTLIASATHSNYFEFEFGEENSGQIIQDDDGRLDYTYTNSGTFVITVRAHTLPETFIETEEQIVVELQTEPGGDFPQTGYTTPKSYSGYNLSWSDEFEGVSLDESSWTYETGTGNNGWGNNELQYYRKENTRVEKGCLIIEAKNENFGGQNYTSSRLITKGKQEFEYGRVDIRAALPKGQGIWPALWMLGSNFQTSGWPACGEIDIMELIGGLGKDNTVHGTVHWDNTGNYANYGDHYTLSNGIFNDEFHVFSIIWNENTIKWYMDDILYNTIDITPTALSEFHQNYFFIFNVAVGGNWPGSPDATTSFPQRMIVDYIRAFQKN